jgi:hypothetical protein
MQLSLATIREDAGELYSLGAQGFAFECGLDESSRCKSLSSVSISTLVALLTYSNCAAFFFWLICCKMVPSIYNLVSQECYGNGLVLIQAPDTALGLPSYRPRDGGLKENDVAEHHQKVE